ncbi:alpha/beta hydrolase family protein [Membranihabitans marinus]|uniref:alpha/beta hydrolase family protein n=1 Tax=Membranihabitans marinus TaxID=1227546 RepID=UPI001F3E2F32|nr:alpha/beta fold hydrolase [Membranihabitans marinus]
MLLVLPIASFLNAQSVYNSFDFYSTVHQSNLTIEDDVAWEKQRWNITANLEQVMGPLPDRGNLPTPTIVWMDSVQTPAYTKWNIRYLAAPNEWVSALLYLPKRRPLNGRSPAMVALHPTGKEGKRIVDGQGRPNRGYGKELAARGYVVIAPDYPSFDDMVPYNFETDRYQSGTMAGIFYHMRSVDLLVSLEQVDANRIGVIGHSLGGHNTLFLAGFDPRLKVAVTSCGFTQFEYYNAGETNTKKYGGVLGPWAQQRYMPWIKEKYDLSAEKLPFNFHEILGLIAPRAIFVNAPVNDGNFDYKGVEKAMSMVQPLFQAMGASSQLKVEYPEAGHDFPTPVRRAAYEYIDAILDHNPSKHEME